MNLITTGAYFGGATRFALGKFFDACCIGILLKLYVLRITMIEGIDHYGDDQIISQLTFSSAGVIEERRRIRFLVLISEAVS